MALTPQPQADTDLIYDGRNTITRPWLLWLQNLWNAVAAPAQARIAQNISPADASVVQMTDTQADGFLRISGGPFTALSIRFPTGLDGQIRSVFFAVAVPAITWLGTTSASLPAAALAGDSVSAQRVAAGDWEPV